MEMTFKAPNGKRALASLIDLLIYSILLEIISWLSSNVLYGLSGIKTIEMQEGLKIQGESIGSLITFALFCCKDTIGGASPGKRIVGIAVRSFKDRIQVPYYGNLIIRNLTWMIWPIEAFVVLNSGDGRRIGDNWCDTQVIDVSRLSVRERHSVE